VNVGLYFSADLWAILRLVKSDFRQEKGGANVMQRFSTIPFHHAMRLHFVGLLAIISLVLIARPTLGQPAEHPATVRQPLVSDTLADEATQETFGLVRVTNPSRTCSERVPC
jgi:hypothetical protein